MCGCATALFSSFGFPKKDALAPSTLSCKRHPKPEKFGRLKNLAGFRIFCHSGSQTGCKECKSLVPGVSIWVVS